jgi:hypothetical protein
MFQYGNASDYLFQVDPSGQFMWGYDWDHCGQHAGDDIYEMHGSGQCELNGEFKLFAKEFVETARIPAFRHPMYVAGQGYLINGEGFGLIEANNHSVFKDKTPVINDFYARGSRPASLDVRYHKYDDVWRVPPRLIPVVISSVASGELRAYNASGTLYNYDNILDFYCKHGRFMYDLLDGASFLYKCKPYNNIDGDTSEYPFRDTSVTLYSLFGYVYTDSNNDGLTQLQIGDVVNASIDSAGVYILESGTYPNFEYCAASIKNYQLPHGSGLIFSGNSIQPNRFSDQIFDALAITDFTRTMSNQNKPLIQSKGWAQEYADPFSGGILYSPIYTAFNLGSPFYDLYMHWNLPRGMTPAIDHNPVNLTKYNRPHQYNSNKYLAYIMSRVKATHAFYEKVYRIKCKDKTTPLHILRSIASGNYIDNNSLLDDQFIGMDKYARIVNDSAVLGGGQPPQSGCISVNNRENTIPGYAQTLFQELINPTGDKQYSSLYTYYDFIKDGREKILEINKQRFDGLLGTGDLETHLWAKYPTRFNRPTSGMIYDSNDIARKTTVDVKYKTWLEPIGSLGDLRRSRSNPINTNLESGFWYHGPASLAVLDRTIDEIIPLHMQNFTATQQFPIGGSIYIGFLGLHRQGGANAGWSTKGIVEVYSLVDDTLCAQWLDNAIINCQITNAHVEQISMVVDGAHVTGTFPQLKSIADDINWTPPVYHYENYSLDGWGIEGGHWHSGWMDNRFTFDSDRLVLGRNNAAQGYDVTVPNSMTDPLNFYTEPDSGGTQTCWPRMFQNNSQFTATSGTGIQTWRGTSVPYITQSSDFDYYGAGMAIGSFKWSVSSCSTRGNIPNSSRPYTTRIFSVSRGWNGKYIDESDKKVGEIRVFAKFNDDNLQDAITLPTDPTELSRATTILNSVVYQSYTTLRSMLAEVYSVRRTDIKNVELVYDYYQPTLYPDDAVIGYTSGYIWNRDDFGNCYKYYFIDGPTFEYTGQYGVLPPSIPDITVRFNGRTTTHSFQPGITHGKLVISVPDEFLDAHIARNNYLNISFHYTKPEDPPPPTPVSCPMISTDYCYWVLGEGASGVQDFDMTGYTDLTYLANPRLNISGCSITFPCEDWECGDCIDC